MNIRVICGNCSVLLKGVKIYMQHTNRMSVRAVPEPINLMSQYECSTCHNKAVIEVDEKENE